jgi:hypothetical protein
VIADHNLGGRSTVFEILGFEADAGTREHAILSAQANLTIDDHVGADAAAIAQLHL